MQGQPHRRFPGEGIAPLRRIVETLASLEMFQTQDPALAAMDPYQMAMKARAAIEPLIK